MKKTTIVTPTTVKRLWKKKISP
jgi:hypothetical protein